MEQDDALRRATSYCAKAEKCRSDIERKLRDWKVERTHWEYIISYLIEHNYLDEERYARAYARDKHRFSALGKHRIESELRNKQISSHTITLVLAELEEEFEIEEQLEHILQSKLRSIPKDLDPNKRYERLMRYAAYKGYDYDDARRIISKLLSHLDIDEEL